MYRGCSTDSTKYRYRSDRDAEGTTVKCSRTSCNNQPKLRKPQLSCVTCKDTKECEFGQKPSSVTACLKDVTFGDEESCFVHSFQVLGNFEIDIE